MLSKIEFVIDGKIEVSYALDLPQEGPERDAVVKIYKGTLLTLGGAVVGSQLESYQAMMIEVNKTLLIELRGGN